MPNTALATDDEYDEVSVSSLEVLEANVAALRDGMSEVKKDIKSLLEKIDRNFERLSTKIDSTNSRIDITNQEVSQLAKAAIRTDSKLNALLWVFGVLGALIPIAFSIGKTFNWF